MDSSRSHSQQGETKQSATTTTTTTTRLGFNTAPAVVPSQESNEHVTTINSLRSASAPRTKLEWRWVRVQMHGATFGTKVTFVHPINKDHFIIVDLKDMPSLFVQPELIPKEYWDKKGMIKRRGHLQKHWLMIYAFLGLSYAERLEVRCLCRLFHEVEKILTLNKHRYKMLKPMPTYTWFPHRKYSSLNELMDKLNEEYAALPDGWMECTAPGTLSVGTVVRARFVNSSGRTLNNFFPAKINQINKGYNDDNKTTFDIVYDDGDSRKNVPIYSYQGRGWQIQRRTVSV